MSLCDGRNDCTLLYLLGSLATTEYMSATELVAWLCRGTRRACAEKQL